MNKVEIKNKMRVSNIDPRATSATLPSIGLPQVRELVTGYSGTSILIFLYPDTDSVQETILAANLVGKELILSGISVVCTSRHDLIKALNNPFGEHSELFKQLQESSAVIVTDVDPAKDALSREECEAFASWAWRAWNTGKFVCLQSASTPRQLFNKGLVGSSVSLITSYAQVVKVSKHKHEVTA